jgi:D-alanyl-D-alanine dipeptidase
MPQGKHWSLAEETVLAKAYLSATQNPYRGTDQTSDDFQQDLVAKFRALCPEYADNGHFKDRSDTAIIEEHRRMKADVQSFNKALNIIWASSPTGCIETEKIAMAVAIHLKYTKKMDYHYKNFEVTTWRYYGAWNTLKNTAKFQFRPFGNGNIDDSAATTPIIDVDATSRENDKENISPLVPTVLLDMSNAKSSSFVGKKGSEEKRRREKLEKEREAAREERHSKLLASLNDSKLYLAHIGAESERRKKENSTVFTLGTTVLALRGRNDPEAVAVVNDCVTLLIKKARATIDEDAALAGENALPPAASETGESFEMPTDIDDASPESKNDDGSEN